MKRQHVASVRFLHPSDTAGLELVYGAGVANEFHRHVHSSLCIGVVDSGTRIIRQEGTTTAIPENGLFVINPGTPHTCWSSDKEGHSYRIICADPEVVAAVVSQVSERGVPVPHFRDVFVSDTRLLEKVRQFFSLQRQSDSILERESVFLSLITQLVLSQADQPPVPSRVKPQRAAIRRVCEFIRANYAEVPSLGQLAGIAGLSPFHFHRVFVQQVGVSPQDYLIQCRIDKARALLLKGHSIVSAALEVGFADQSHFTRFFNRVVGIPPGRYLRLHRVPPDSIVRSNE